MLCCVSVRTMKPSKKNGRSPTMRHVSRTHKVAVDWLFGRINLDSTIQIRYIDVTNGTIFFIRSTSAISALLAVLRIPDKLHQNDGEKGTGKEGEERIVAKSNSTAMNLSSHVPTSSSSAKSPIASKSPGLLIATWKPERRMRRNSKSDAAPCSKVRLQDAHLGGLMDTATEKLVATHEESGDVDLAESETGSEEVVTGKPVAFKTAAVKPMHPINQLAREAQKLKR